MDMKQTILVADDDAGVSAVVARALEPGGYEMVRAFSGTEALAAAARRAPDLVLLDVHMPGLSGWEVLARLRIAAATRNTPVMMLTGCGETHDKVEGFGLGADDYVTKPFALDELRARVFGLLRRHREAMSASPLTGLPGSPSIQADVERRIAEDSPFALIHADIDRFKPFNDAYGFARGDAAIRETARVLGEALSQAGDPGGFLGHVGGDDFVMICTQERAETVAALAARLFDESSPRLHDPADAARGFIERPDRLGRPRRDALLSLTLGGASTRLRRLDSYAKAVSLADEMKSWLKRRGGSGPSAWSFDRRRDAPEAHA
jgi:PleD family two-component response regulator